MVLFGRGSSRVPVCGLQGHVFALPREISHTNTDYPGNLRFPTNVFWVCLGAALLGSALALLCWLHGQGSFSQHTKNSSVVAAGGQKKSS